jgi:gas vesicle protein
MIRFPSVTKEQQMKRTTGTEIFASFALGLGVGAVAGLFFAPKSGEQLREDIANGAVDGLNQVRSAGKKIGKRAQVLVDRASGEISDAVEAGENAYTNAKKDQQRF